MSWWVALLFPVPGVCLMAVATLIGVALNVSAEDRGRRLPLTPDSRAPGLADVPEGATARRRLADWR